MVLYCYFGLKSKTLSANYIIINVFLEIQIKNIDDFSISHAPRYRYNIIIIHNYDTLTTPYNADPSNLVIYTVHR